MTDEKQLYTVAEAARELAVSVPTIWRWIDKGKLKAYRVGGRAIRIRAEDLQAMLEPVQPARIAEASAAYGERKPMTPEEGKRYIARLRRLHEEQLRQRGGVPFPDSAELIRQIREEHFESL